MRFNFLHFLLLLLPVLVQAQPESALIDGKTVYVYPFQANRPYYYPDLFKGIHYRENGSGGTREIERLTVEKEISADERKLLAFIRKETPWLYYHEQHFDIGTPAPTLDSLPDGDYVQYYQGLPYVDGDTIKFHYGKTATRFSLRNNLPDGPFLLFTSYGDTAQVGTFRHGQPDGSWKLMDYRYPASDDPVDSKAFIRQMQEFISNGKCQRSSITRRAYANGTPTGVWEIVDYDIVYPEKVSRLTRTSYENGAMNGPYEEYSYGLLTTKGTYSNWEPSGEWFHYQVIDPYGKTPRAQLVRHYRIPEERKTGRGPIIRDYFYESDNDTLIYGSKGLKNYGTALYPVIDHFIITFNHFYDIPQPDSAMAANPYTRYVYDEWVQNNTIFLGKSRQVMTRQQAIDSVGYHLRYSFYEEFYPTGQLLLRFQSHEGQLEKEDTIFWDNGQATNVVNYLPETDQYEEKMFNREGQLVKRDLFDAKGAFLQTTVNRTGVRPPFIRLEGLNYVDNHNGQYVYQLPYNQPQFSGVTVIRASVRDTDSSLIEHTVFDPATYRLTKRTQLGPCITVTDGIVDSSGMIFTGTSVANMGDFSRTLPMAADQSDYMFAVNLPNRVMSLFLYAYDDSVPLLYRGKPYTGKIGIHYDSDSTYYRYAKGLLEVFIEKTAANGFFIDQLIKFPNYTAEYYSRSADRLPGPVSGNYTNGFPDGAWKFTFPNGKLQCRYTLVNGVPQGKVKSYAMAYPEEIDSRYNAFNQNDTFPKRATYFLVNETEYTEEEISKVLWSKSRDWTGRITSSYNNQTGESFQRTGKQVTRYIRNSDSTIATILNEVNGNEVLLKRTATMNPPKYVPQPEDEEDEEAEPIKVVSRSVEWDYQPWRGTEQFYYPNGKVFQLKRTDSLSRIVFFETYFPNGDLLEKVYLSSGRPSAYERWENGTIKRRFEFHPEDSVAFRQLHWLRPADGKEGLHFPYDPAANSSGSLVPINCRLENYDQNGVKRSEGGLIKLQKSETWNYYNAQGIRVAEIDYTVPVLILDSNDLHPLTGEAAAKDSSGLVFKTNGKRLLYDASGNLIAEQLIIELSVNYSCVQDDYYETRNYYTLWESDTTLHLRNGHTKHRDENGELQCEGQSINGLPEGFWKFYNPDGTIKEAGLYHKGKRHGRWLSGDLSKVKYLADLCLDPNGANSQKTVKELQNNLDIMVVYYKMGERLSREFFNVTVGE